MSEQPNAILEIPASNPFANRSTLPLYKLKPIDPSQFSAWARKDMYKSTYAHHHSPMSVEPRTSLIPGYGGYLPKKKSQNLHAKGYTSMSKDVFAKGVEQNVNGIATTGFNLKRQHLIDNSKLASSSKYGKTQLQRPHPGWQAQQWTTTTKSTYLHPQSQTNPLYRDTPLQTTKPHTKTSGFAQNRAYWDGNGWNPLPVLHPLNKSTEYRDRHNPEMQYHRDVNINKAPQLRKSQLVYKYNL